MRFIVASGGSHLTEKDYIKVSKALPLLLENQVALSLYNNMNLLNFDFLEKYGQLPKLTQDEADVLTHKFLKFKQFENDCQEISSAPLKDEKCQNNLP